MDDHSEICSYCGKPSSELTRDHVVPKALWGGKGNLPSHVVVVPACRPCQEKWDIQAEYFRNTVIAMIDKGAHPVASEVLEGPVIRSLQRNPKTVAAFFRDPRILPRSSPGGIVTGYGLAFQIDMERFNRIPEKIVRGLFYYKSHHPLPSTHGVKVFPGNQSWDDDSFQNLLAVMEPIAGCGDDVFQIRCTRDRTDPCCTAWLLLFYRQLGVFALTQRVEEALPPQTVNATAGFIPAER